jgi:hypothetical protein
MKKRKEEVQNQLIGIVERNKENENNYLTEISILEKRIINLEIHHSEEVSRIKTSHENEVSLIKTSHQKVVTDLQKKLFEIKKNNIEINSQLILLSLNTKEKFESDESSKGSHGFSLYSKSSKSSNQSKNRLKSLK